MKKYTEEDIRAVAKILSTRGAQKGGKARWDGKTAEEKRAHAMIMVDARRKNKS